MDVAMGCLHVEKIPMQEIGVKEGGGCYSKGVYVIPTGYLNFHFAHLVLNHELFIQ